MSRLEQFSVSEKFTKYGAYIPTFDFTAIEDDIIRKVANFCSVTLYITENVTKDVNIKDINYCFNSVLRYYFHELYTYEIGDLKLKSYYQANLLEHMICAILSYQKYKNHHVSSYKNAIEIIFIYVREFIIQYKKLYGDDILNSPIVCSHGLNSKTCFKQMLFINKQYVDGIITKEKFIDEFAFVCFFFKEQKYVPLP